MTTTKLTWKQAAWSFVAALVALPLLFAVTGCDSNGSGMDEDINGDDDQQPTQLDQVAGLYDTTTTDAGDTLVVINEENGEGVIEGGGSGEVTWTSNYTWVIDGRIFVNADQTLNIEPGTVVKGRARVDPNNASVLIVAQDGTINAEGTADNPIIFTAEEDDVTDPDDLSENLDGAWGGLIILGNAPTNTDVQPNVEGIPTSESRGKYGGDDAGDSSGILKYVSIRYGGIEIGAGNEINGLTLGGVGNGTTIEYIEVFNNQDDGVEWFGGTVNTKHLLVARTGDDSFDIDQGYTGYGQFWVAIQTATRGDRTAEHDSGDDDFGGEDSTPVANPQIYNVTYVGSGASNGEGDVALKLRDNFAGDYRNAIMFDFPAQLVEIEDVDDTNTGDSRARWENDELKIENNIFWGFALADAESNTDDAWRAFVENDGSYGDEITTYLQNNNEYKDPGITRSSLVPTNDVTCTAPAADGEGFLDTNASYCGAFDPNGTNWALGWTFSSKIGLIQ